MKTLIDIEVITNFILLKFIRKVNILLKRKSDVYRVIVIEEESFEYNKEKIN